jgi:NodT family efflux transporter outer membrane factor (OMF) lipoprotein
MKIKLAPALLLLLAGCAVGPDYHRPDAPTAAAFKELDGWKPATPADLADRGAWWRVFHDPLLDELESRVEISNQTLREYVAAYEQSVAVVDEARASLFPSVSLAPSVSRGKTSSAGKTSSSLGATASASWELDLWGKLRRTVRGEVASAQASAADLANARLSAQSQLAIDYFELRAADELTRLYAETVAADQRALTITRNQHAAGTVTETDVITAETELKSAQSSLLNAGVQRAELEHAIAVLTGQPPAALTLAPGPLPAEVPIVPAGLPSDLLERRPDIAAAERDIAAENEQIGIAIAGYYPSLTLSADAGVTASSMSKLFNAADRVWSLGASASQTLFDAGSTSASVRAARAAYDEKVATYRATVLSALQGVEDYLSTLRILQAQSTTQAETVALAQRALDLTLNQYRAGTLAYTSVVTAQNTLLSARQTLVTLQQDRLVASVNLITALGGGWQSTALPSP